MAHASTRRVAHLVSGGVLTASLLGACGGGAEVFAILQIVTPLGGQWATEGNETIDFSSPDPEVQLLNGRVDVTARVASVSGVCGDTKGDGVEVVGTVDNGKATLRVDGTGIECVRGSFTSLIQFDAEAIGAVAARSYFNSRVDVQMGIGLWVSENGLVTLKFEEPSTVDNNSDVSVKGCDVSSAAAKVRFSETIMSGYSTTTQARPSIAELLNSTNSALMYSQVEFVDGATLTLRNSAGQTVTLHRKPDPANTSCS